MKSITKFILLATAATMFFSCTKERSINEPGNLVPKTVEQDPGLPSITVNGIKLHSEAYGHPDSTIVLVLHGGPGGDYRSLLNAGDLANYGYRVVFYDQRGSGLSQRLPKDFYLNSGNAALDAIIDEVGGVIDHYRMRPGQKVVLLGHSWGGILATAYAGKYPNSIDGLIVCEPGGLKWSDIDEFIKTSNEFAFWGELLNDAVFMEQFMSGKENQHEILDYKFGLVASRNENTGDGDEDNKTWRINFVIDFMMFGF